MTDDAAFHAEQVAAQQRSRLRRWWQFWRLTMTAQCRRLTEAEATRLRALKEVRRKPR